LRKGKAESLRETLLALGVRMGGKEKGERWEREMRKGRMGKWMDVGGR
jgi:hypothetical protein